MTRNLVRIGLGVLFVIGLYFTVIVGMIAGGFIVGLVAGYHPHPPVTSIVYYRDSAAHPPSDSAAPVQSSPAAPQQ